MMRQLLVSIGHFTLVGLLLAGAAGAQSNPHPTATPPPPLVSIVDFQVPGQALVGRRIEGSLTTSTLQRLRGQVRARLTDSWKQTVFDDRIDRSFLKTETFQFRVETSGQARGDYVLQVDIMSADDQVLSTTATAIRLVFVDPVLTLEAQRPSLAQGIPLEFQLRYSGKEPAALTVDLLSRPHKGWRVVEQQLLPGQAPPGYTMPTGDILPGVYYLRASAQQQTSEGARVLDRVILPVSIFPAAAGALTGAATDGQ
jgi:hypothetical protein